MSEAITSRWAAMVMWRH